MKPTNHVRFWEIKTLKPGPDGKKRKRPYGVRWVTAGREHSSWFTTKALANSELTKLRTAANQGEAFDIDSGLPESMYRERNSRTLLQVAQRFIASEWEDSAPNTRRRNVDTLAVVVSAFVKQGKGKPDERVVRRVLSTCLLPVNGAAVVPGSEMARAAAWLAENSRLVVELAEEEEMAELLRALGRNLGGKPAAAWTARTRRGVLHHALSYAVKLGELAANPVSGAKVVQRGNSEVDPRVVVNPQQARQMLAAVTYVGRRGAYEYLYGFFAAMYYAALRPCEVGRLREADCTLPAEGWGELVLSASASRSNARYVDSGEVWEERALKRRAQGAVRVVPIPPQLVVILRAHLDRFGTAEDGRLFRSAQTGAPMNASVYTGAWKRARVVGLAPAQEASPLVRRPYDLRHAAVSTWLAAGVPAAEVAERAGHTVDVLLKVYARCLDGQRDNSNQRITELLA